METNNANTNLQNDEKQYEYTQMSMLENNTKPENFANAQVNQDNSGENRSNIEELSGIKTKADAEKLLEASGVNYTDLQKEYYATGKISDLSREKLLKSGISNEFIDEYIKGQQAVYDVELNEVSECIGGRQNLDPILKWAEKNLSQEEKISINTIHDKNLLKIILKDLKNRMEEKEGITPNYIRGDGAKTISGVFRSKAEMFDAISNPRYRKDEAYRSDVQKIIAASMRAGIDLGI